MKCHTLISNKPYVWHGFVLNRAGGENYDRGGIYKTLNGTEHTKTQYILQGYIYA